MLCNNVANSKVKIASLGGIEDILAAMKEHKSNGNVQKYGCTALSNLTMNQGRKRKRV